jgi:hypothetical protein
MAVGLRLGDVIGADDARAGSPVLHHEALAEALGQAHREDAADDVGAASRGERNHEPHRPHWPGVLGRRGRPNEGCCKDRQDPHRSLG